MYNIKVVPANIKLARLSKDFSQGYMAKKLKISEYSYDRIENGSKKIVLSVLFNISDILDLDVIELFKTTMFSEKIAS